jgi:predicted RNA binding protein YcfA (HicA-like mRNA interferase family)
VKAGSVPNRLGSSAIASILLEHGFSFISQKGSHQKYRDRSGHVVIVPAGRREIPVGTLLSIIRQSGLDKKLFN